MGRLDGSPEGGGRQGGMEGIRQSGLWSYGAMSSTGMGRKPAHRLEKQGCQWMQARYMHITCWRHGTEKWRGGGWGGGMIPRRTNAASSCKQLQGLHIISEPMTEPPAARPEVRGDPGLVEQVCMPSTGCHDRHGPFEARFFFPFAAANASGRRPLCQGSSRQSKRGSGSRSGQVSMMKP